MNNINHEIPWGLKIISYFYYLLTLILGIVGLFSIYNSFNAGSLNTSNTFFDITTFVIAIALTSYIGRNIVKNKKGAIVVHFILSSIVLLASGFMFLTGLVMIQLFNMVFFLVAFVFFGFSFHYIFFGKGFYYLNNYQKKTSSLRSFFKIIFLAVVLVISFYATRSVTDFKKIYGCIENHEEYNIFGTIVKMGRPGIDRCIYNTAVKFENKRLCGAIKEYKERDKCKNKF